MRRADSIRTRHQGGIVHGSLDRPARLVIAAEQITVADPPLLSLEEAEAAGYLDRHAAAELLGLTPGRVSALTCAGRLVPVAYTKVPAGWSSRRTPLYDPDDLAC